MIRSGVFATEIPADLDRLLRGRRHWLGVILLGIACILNGLELALVGSLAGVLVQKHTVALTAGDLDRVVQFALRYGRVTCPGRRAPP